MASGLPDRYADAAREPRSASQTPSATRPGPVTPTEALTSTARRNGPNFSGPIDTLMRSSTSRAAPTATAESAYHSSGERCMLIFAVLFEQADVPKDRHRSLAY